MTPPVLDPSPSPAPDQSSGADGILVSIILPAYNEAEALPTVLSDLQRIVDDRYEIIVVDDGSTDNTVAVASDYPCRVIEHQFNRGKGAAVQTGLSKARGQYLVVMDANGTYPASVVPRIVELLASNDLVRCNRVHAGDYQPWTTRLWTWSLDRMLSLVNGLDGVDQLSGMYGLRRGAVMPMQLESLGFAIEAEIGVKARLQGLRIATFPVEYQPGRGERPLYEQWRNRFLTFAHLLVIVLTYNPLMTFITPGFLIMLAALVGAGILREDRIVTPYLGLSVHSFIVMALGAVASFQLVVFGMAAALYGVEAGYRPPKWLIWAGSRMFRLGSAAVGFLMAIWGAVNVAQMIIRWITVGPVVFTETRALVLAATLAMLGLQIISAALFLSIFASRLQRLAQMPVSEVRAPAGGAR
jgi:hypothetical protein